MKLTGNWFESGRAASSKATLHVSGNTYRVVTSNGETSSGLFADVSISARLGQLERKLQLPDGSLFATKDNDAVDQILTAQGGKTSLVQRLESSWRWVVVALVLTVLVSISFVRWGLPALSHSIAYSLPHSTGVLIGSHTMEFLDDYFFAPSQLEQSEQDQIREHFYSQLVPAHQVDSEIQYTLHFRALGEGDDAIPNAMALPSGDIILTDRFVQLSENQNEIDAVLLHEMGHVEYRHTLEMVTQSTIVVVLLTVLTGDVSGTGDLGIGLGSLLITSGYSRRFEGQADQFAFNNMIKAGIDPIAFATIMDKITQSDKSSQPSDSADGHAEITWIDYLSSHPNTQERIALAKRYARCFKDGLTTCPASLNTSK